MWAKGKVNLNGSGDKENGEEGIIEEKVQKRFENTYNCFKIIIVIQT